MKIDRKEEHYSNMAYLSVNARDAYFDFLKTPGVINDGITVITGVRTYMQITAAQRLSEALARTVKKVAYEDRTVDLNKGTKKGVLRQFL